MTKEELEKEADKYADDYATPDLDCSFRAHMFEASKEAYLAGAEPREKRIAELEQKLEQTEKDLADYQFNYPKIKDLEKENAELKEEMKAKQVVLNDFKSRVETITDRFNKKSSQLTKAKEIIKDLLGSENTSCEEEMFFEIRQKAEQFLKEIEK